MNIHKNARLTFARRLEMVQDITPRGLSQGAAALAQGVSGPRVRKWLGRYLAQGEAALIDRSSRPRQSPRAIAPVKALAIVELRRHRLTQARIATNLGVSKSTVGPVLKRAGLSHLKDLEPTLPVLRKSRLIRPPFVALPLAVLDHQPRTPSIVVNTLSGFASMPTR